MKRMLFNATQAEELRVAIVDGQKLIDLDIESAAKEQRKSNIYKGVITRIEPSLEAAFVNYGEERHGFLPFKEISRSYFQPGVEPGKATIKEALREGQEVIVQVEKDERGNKGAALTTFISLAGRYLVLMPNNPRGGGVSRRVEGDERAELREVMDQLEVPSGMSLIARTAAIGRNVEELQWDLNYLLQLWSAIDGAATSQNGPFLIYLEGSLVIRAIRDYFQPDIGEILIDTDEIYEQARAFMGTVMPTNINRVKRYHDDVPLFSRFQIEHQIESAYSRQVNLPSGGAIVIDHTEALVSVDVNSGRATRGQDIEETALKTNQEAADEIARQLRLRDLGGLIVIDFIDMESARNQREVENRLRDALRFDRARVQMGKISRFGLMELSRQRLRPALAETSYIPCPRCNGTGHIRSTESSALHILRILEEEAMKDNTAAVHTQVPVDVATFLLNEKRADIAAIEIRHKVSILLIPNIHFETPQHTIIRLRHDDLNSEDMQQPSYKMMEMAAEEVKLPSAQTEPRQPRQEAAIKSIAPELPAPVVEEKPVAQAAPQPGFFSKILSIFRGKPSATVTEESSSATTGKSRNGRRDGQSGRGDRQRNGERGERGERGDRRGRGRGDRTERGERGNANDAAPASREAGREQREGREGREGRDNNRRHERNGEARQERQDRRERAQPQDELPQDTSALTQQQTPSAARGERAERGERGERGRRRGRQNDAQQDPLAATAALAGETVAAPSSSPIAAPAEAPLTAAQADADALPTNGDAVAGEEGGNGGRSRRGRRGGRRDRGERGERSERRPQDGDSAETQTAADPLASTPVDIILPATAETTSGITFVVEPEAPAAAPETTASADVAAIVATAPAQEAAAPAPTPVEAPAAPIDVASPVVADAAPTPELVQAEASTTPAAPVEEAAPASVASVAESTPAPVSAAPAPVASAAPVAPAAPIQLPADCGLVMVETDPVKVATVAVAPVEAPAPRQRRQRPAVQPVSDEPLVMVETRQS